MDLGPLSQLVPYFGCSTQSVGEQALTSDSTPLESTLAHQLQGTAPHCGVGERPRFSLAFAELKRRVGSAMGMPAECAHTNPDNGDTLQRTTIGLAVYHRGDDSLRFTDGWRHWALVGGRELEWEGTAADPPRSLGRLDLRVERCTRIQLARRDPEPSVVHEGGGRCTRDAVRFYGVASPRRHASG